MSKVLIITDPHLDPRRIGGTTMESRAALEAWQFNLLEEVVSSSDHDYMLINGDLFDKRSATEKTLVKVWDILKDEEVVIVRGNHDENSMKFDQICSLQALSTFLPQAQLIFDEPTQIDEGMYVIPHCFDQETFDRHVAEVPAGNTVFLHANFDNHFAVESDHSLNLSMEQFEKLRENNCQVVMGHEHTAKQKEGLTLLGCTMPTSIADCMGGDKYIHYYDTTTREITRQVVWKAAEDYIEMDWSELVDTNCRFIKITGDCAVSVYPEVIRNIAKYRKNSTAFIVKNAVKVAVVESAIDTTQEVDQFNIMELVIDQIPEEFREEVKKCI